MVKPGCAACFDNHSIPQEAGRERRCHLGWETGHWGWDRERRGGERCEKCMGEVPSCLLGRGLYSDGGEPPALKLGDFVGHPPWAMRLPGGWALGLPKG